MTEITDDKIINNEMIDSSKSLILAVDDQPITMKLIKKYLTTESYEIVPALNGEEALAKIEQYNFDLIILDVMMPKMNGFDVCRAVRQKFSLFELPIIFLTAKNQLDDLIKGFDAGANDYLTKPFERNELITRAKTLIKLRKLTHSNKILQEAIDLKNKILSMAIHDLKNPLTSIIALSDLIYNDIDKDNSHRELLSTISTSADIMLALINDLLEAAKIDSGNISLSKELVDVNSIAETVINNNLQKAKNKNQEITFYPVLDLDYKLYADKNRLTQIFDNLLSNAIKFSPIGKPIVFKIIIAESRSKNGIFIRVEIQDSGPGFSSEDKEKMFNRYQKLSAKPTAGESSTGLGLSIVKELVAMHNGRVWAESIPNQGATFFVELPLNLI